MPTVLERVTAVVVDKLRRDPNQEVTPETSFIEDLGADSLDLVELVMAFEEEFSDRAEKALEISDKEAAELTTVQNAVDYIIAQGVKDE